MNPQLSLAKTMALACGGALLMIGVVLSLLGVPGAVQAAPTATIQSLIDLAPDGGTVNIPSGTYTESLTVNKTLTLTGVSSSTTIIQAVTGQRVITVTAGHNLRLENLTVTGGHPSGSVGGGIFAANDLHIVNCRLANNSADYGGGVFQNDNVGRVDVIGSRIELNTTGNHGGGLYVSGNVALTNTQVLSNAAAGHGGGLHVQTGRVDLAGGVLANNTAGMNGGAVNVNASINVTGTQFISNTSNDSGGALVQWREENTATLTNARFERNTARIKGGGAYVSGTLTISNSNFVSNTVDSGDTAETYGGGVYAGGTSQIYASTFVSNSARYGMLFSYGGGVSAPRPATIQDSTFDNNSAFVGGGICSYDFFGNAAITVTHSTFKNNAAGDGGGLWATELRLSSAQFISNTATRWGGGVVIGNFLYVVNTLFVDNQAAWYGAALELDGNRHTLHHVTIAHPTQGNGPAIRAAHGTTDITDTIVASYTIGISYTGSILNADYNLFFTAIPTQTSGGTMNWGSHNLNANPRFVNPAAGDYHLADGSPAIDKGTNVGVAIDLDGVTRPQDNGYDIGAYEFRRFSIFLPMVVKQ